MYFSFVRPIIEYADIIWDNCPNIYKKKLEKLNIEADRIVTGGTKLTTLGDDHLILRGGGGLALFGNKYSDLKNAGNK